MPATTAYQPNMSQRWRSGRTSWRRCTRASRRALSGPSRGGGPGVYLRGAAQRPRSARTAGSWPRRRASATPDGMQRLLNAGAVGCGRRCATICVALCASSTWATRRRPGRRRDGLPQERDEVGRGGAAVQRHGGADRELPDRRVPGLCQPRARPEPGAPRPRALPAPGVGRATRSGGRRRASPRRWRSPPSPNWRDACSSGLARRGLPAAWVTGDKVYGGSGPLRAWLEEQRAALRAGDRQQRRRGPALAGGDISRLRPRRSLATPLRRTPGSGSRPARASKGPRVSTTGRGCALAPPAAAGFEQALLVRRPRDAPDDPKQLAYYLTFAPSRHARSRRWSPWRARRWTIEESFAAAKGEVGLDHYEVRHCHGWYRHITLAMLALAFLAVVRARLPGAQHGPKGGASMADRSAR